MLAKGSGVDFVMEKQPEKDLISWHDIVVPDILKELMCWRCLPEEVV